MAPLQTVLVGSLTALALAACGPGGDGAGEAADAGGAAGATGTSVSIVDNAFEPATLEVGAGDTVTWVHDGEVTHTVTFEDDDSGDLEPGDTHERTFDEAGEHDYVCTIHASMTGTVSVSG